MANTPQAIKRVKQNKKHALRNHMQHSRLRTAIKKLLKSIQAKAENIKNTFGQVTSLIDKAATKGIIQRNKASRLKSRLNKRVKDHANG